MHIDCEYYIGYLGGRTCLLGDCYISQMPEETPQKTINEHIKNCVLKKAGVKTLLKKDSGKLEQAV